MDAPIRIFAVEDDPVFSRMLEYVLNLDPELEVQLFENGLSMLEELHKKPSIITLDYTLPDISGEGLLRKIQYVAPNIPVIVISGQEDIKTAINLLKSGAHDYIAKDEDIRERLLNSINNIKKNISLSKEVEMLREELHHKYDFSASIIGNSSPMQRVFALLSKTVSNNITVSITGETGTGKELVAKAIHFNSTRKVHPFVAVNVAAIPETLIESELFGHEKGAFTGAVARRIGKFEEAQKGTIFIDEIGELNISLQAKLLRVLQERELIRIGGNQTLKLNVRIVTATHKDLAEEVKKGNFREDLYYRLLGMPIQLPPLRDRGSDVILIARYLIDEFAKENKMGKLHLTKEAQIKIQEYPFPGNVRELKAIIDLACVMCQGGEIQPEDIQFNGPAREQDFFSKELPLKEYTFRIVRRFLDRYDDNVLLVAEKLDIGKSTIYRYLKEMEELGI